MKKSELRQLIKEEQSQMQNENVTQKLERDELGKFYVVILPNKPKQEIVFDFNLLSFAKAIKSGAIDVDKLVGVYEKSGEAKRKSKELLDVVETEINELNATMEEYRSHKSESATKRQKAIDIINKYK